MQLTHYQRVYFQVSGKGVDEKRGDPLIRDFRKRLESLKVKNPPVSASVFSVDNFEIEQKNQDLYKGKYLVRWEIVDSEVGWETRMNHQTRALLTKAILEISFSNDSLTIRATDVKDGTYE